MLDEFYHVGRMDSLISKITISAGYGFRMAIVMQDIAQLDELYGRSTRITTVSGSQIKLFIQINDLDTSEFVSEMLGETTQVYRTPVMRPGQGIFAPRVWTPPYTPRPLRSPLELREMSARLSILMVKNSPSFELTKIRHYLDKPYRALYEAAKGSPPALPRRKEWQDEALSGAIAPRAEPELAEAEEAVSAKPEPDKDSPAPRRPRKSSVRLKQEAPTPPEQRVSTPAPLELPARPTATRPRTKTLSLGAAPTAPPGENCDVREILAAAADGQDEDFASMLTVLRADAGPRCGRPQTRCNRSIVPSVNTQNRSERLRFAVFTSHALPYIDRSVESRLRPDELRVTAELL
ncbi:TraM recognition domain-containing protein [Labrys sp. 22185]|uniref:TraG/TraD/VirD4 family protein n=1 Tax=Labrys sp. 22185 TaxID=3453888 RepID=UPI003F85422B